MNNSNTKKKKIDFIGLLSLKFVDWFSTKSNLTDDEVKTFMNICGKIRKNMEGE